MLRLTLAAGVACAVVLGNPVGAQNSSSMPGTVVGGYRGQVNPVGTKAPAAAPQVGDSITKNPLMRPYDPNRPYDAFKGTNINPNSLVAPLIGPDGRPIGEPDALDRLSAKVRALLVRPDPAPPRPPYAPGVTRRSHERAQHMWRRD